MTQKELHRVHVIQQGIDGVLTNGEAAQILGLSKRQVIRLKKGVRKAGPQSIIHHNRGRQPLHALPQSVKDQIVSLKTTPVYQRANFTHFTELLSEREQIPLSRSTVYRILTQAGIKSPKTHRQKTIHRRRARKEARGRLVQIDASPFSWITERGSLSLHGAIDDATGQVLGLFLGKSECLSGYFTLMHQVITPYGLPLELYADRHTIFFSPQTSQLTLEDELAGKVVPLTQFGRAMNELGIHLIPAFSPQAKGRVERLWETLQSRIPVEFALQGITTIEEANHFLETQFLPHFNGHFARTPKDPQPAFRPLCPSLDLSTILCLKASRKSDTGGVISYQGVSYQILPGSREGMVPARSQVTVCQGPEGEIRVMDQGIVYPVIPIPKPPLLKPAEKPLQKKKSYPSPPPTHPWKQERKVVPSVEYSDREILENLLNSTAAWR
ncbi:MAG: ISNCY family transposase [Atribacterota bacterium]